MALRFILAALAAIMVALGDAAAQAEPAQLRTDPFSALVGKRKPAEERARHIGDVERFVVATDDRVFLFQPDPREARLKFLCGDDDKRIDCAIDSAAPSEEILLLSPVRASRGDVIWNDRRGRTVLRVAAYGGVTVFWPGDQRGLAASKSFGEDPPLTLEFATIETARERAQTATALVSAKIGAPMIFAIGDPAPDADGGARVLADAVLRAASGVASVAGDPTGARVIAARIRRVEFESVSAPAVSLREEALMIGYNPGMDVAGRPSSGSIARFLEEEL